MDCPAAVTALTNRPASFLRHYPVKCAGGLAPNQNVATTIAYRMIKPTAMGAHTKEGHRGATRPGVFGIGTRDISSFKLEPGGAQAGAGTIAQAHVVPMVNYSGNAYGCFDLQGGTGAMPHYVLDGTGDGLMVTGGLSNCCFAWLQQGAELWCIHVQPGGDLNPIQLQNRLVTNGRFAAAPGQSLATFGRSDYPGGTASVIGVREGGVWNLYAQKSNDSFSTLSEAYRIHPGLAVRL
jgi:hypothetical protein